MTVKQYSRLTTLILFVLVLLWSKIVANAGVISGMVYDSGAKEPIPFVTVFVMGTGKSILANENGQYQLRLPPGVYQLKFSHIAYYSDLKQVNITDSKYTLDVHLEKAVINVPGITVYSRVYDPAQKIIMQAIRHKKKILSQLRSYQCQAYVKTVQYRNHTDDSSSIEVIAESQMECLWKYPEKYKEIIKSRRQTTNIPADLNLVNIEAIPNFNMNRITFKQYSIVSPVAEDALEYYNYYLLDTVFIDGRMVFRLEVEPKNRTDPLICGTVEIADSSFAVVGADGGFGDGVYLPLMKNFHYIQRFMLYENRYWMPNEIHMTYTVNLAFPVEMHLSIDYVAALYDYDFNVAMPSGTFDLVLEVAKDVDDGDSTNWNAHQTIPLTDQEKTAYHRIDSIANAPKPIYKKFISGFWRTWNYFNLNPDLFHFNRVEGAYLGYKHYWYGPTPRINMSMKAGYAFSRELWEYHYGFYYKLSNKWQLWTGLLYRNDIQHRPSILNSGQLMSFNPTWFNLLFKSDPLDYYREKGFAFQVSAQLMKQTQMRVKYNDFQQFSENINTNYSLFEKNKEYRENPAIDDGTLRSISVTINYDSRPLAKIKGKDYIKNLKLYTEFGIGMEVASPSLIDNDFDYMRYFLHVKHSGHIILPGVACVELYAGSSDRILPSQKYYTVDFTYKIVGDGMYYRTAWDNNFAGDRVAALYFSNDFGPWLFQQSGLPLVRNIPFSISFFGGMFWTDFRNRPARIIDDNIVTAQRAYSEIGFSIGRIELPPAIYRLDFAWQLSQYDTHKFAVCLGLDL